jgi:hypothetical protein
MITLDEPPLFKGSAYIISIIIILSLLLPLPAHEAFDNRYKSEPEIGWDSVTIEAPLLVISKEFAPEVKEIPVGYGNGSCVPYARAKTGIQLTGWAGTFLNKAEDAGYATSTVPALNGMVITNESKGHVAVVEEITEDAIIVSEQNYKGKFIVSSRKILLDDPKIQGYIY